MASLTTLAMQEQTYAKEDMPRVTSYGSNLHMAHEQAGSGQHSSALDKTLRYAGIGTTALSLTPYLMKKAGVGEKEFQFFAANCCPVIQKNGPSWTTTSYGEPTYGIAGAIASGLERIPMVGGELSRGGIAKALGAGGLMLLGHYGGHALEGNAPAHSMRHRLGRGLGDTARLLGLVVAVPCRPPCHRPQRRLYLFRAGH